MPYLLGAVCVLFSAANASVLVQVLRTRQHASMVAPFVGGVCGAIALTLLGHLRWAWVPLLTDASCVPALVLLLVAALRGEKKD